MELFLYFFKSYPRRTILIFFAITIASIITTITLLALPALLATMIGRDTSKTEFINTYLLQLGINPTTENLLIFLMVGIVLQNLFLAGAKIYAGFTVAKVVKDLRIQLVSTMSQTEWSYFIQQSSGKFTAAMVNEIEKSGTGYITIIEIIAILVQICAYLSVAFLISWEIAVLAILCSLVLTILFSKLISFSRDLGTKDTHLIRQITEQVSDSFRNIKALKAMARESHSHAILNDYAKQIKNVAKKNVLTSETLNMLQDILLMGTIIFTVYFAFNSLDLSLSSGIILIIIYLKAMKQFGKAQKRYQSFVTNVANFQSAKNRLDNLKNNPDKNNGTIKSKLSKGIQLSKLNFYHKDTQILKDASAYFPHKKITSIYGSSGAGKTTIVDLICGLYNASSGNIYIDETTINDIDIKYWRKQIGYVVQENNLLNTTIKENITLGDPSFSDSQVELALEKAHALTFVKNIEEGIYSHVGENGTNISGGQKQRILIARAIVHSPNLVILDEATSALDIETEISICDVFKELSKEMCIISISHRPAMLEVSDQALEIRDKKIFIR